MGADTNYAAPFKGRFAEAIIEALFTGSGMDIRRTGYEWIQPLLRGGSEFNSRIRDNLVGMPDFYLLLPRLGSANGVDSEFIEVKFCWDGHLPNGRWSEVEELKCNPWRPTLIVVQRMPWVATADGCRMRVYHPPYKMSRGYISESESVLSQKHWNLNPEVYRVCDKLIDLYEGMNEILTPSEKVEVG